MSKKLLFYNIDSEYINYLKKYQKHIWNNDDKDHVRPYVGIVVEMNGFNYYAPLSSPKGKHNNMDERLDFIKIEDKTGLKAVINLNNIIPVSKENIFLVDLDNQDEPYRRLLMLEGNLIRKKKNLIINNAKSIYDKVVKYAHENLNLVRICYNFKLLEQKCLEYQAYQEVALTLDEYIEPKGIKENVEVEKTEV
ncbi:type III toxin-antitoxin system ToxN/AbiQ family toxin [Clostridium botulinum]|nr:type III toxin-antitoxin system ToxN/AbiQ family toxin [Clostridium botulinum]